MPYEPTAYRPPHAAQRATYDRAYNHLARGSDEARGLAQRVRSGVRWRRVRDVQLGRHPLCQDCKGHGRIVPATQVDHVVPLVLDPGLAYDLANLRSLCTRCHGAKSGQERRDAPQGVRTGARGVEQVRTGPQVGGGVDSEGEGRESGPLDKPVFSRVSGAQGVPAVSGSRG